ncbi:hypothetical protein [Kitasatospora griseola]|uniref:hypothetical protein n=1 Tax=Kitasatospora griseola TaxID=2064 RepID=UPI00341AD0A3
MHLIETLIPAAAVIVAAFINRPQRRGGPAVPPGPAEESEAKSPKAEQQAVPVDRPVTSNRWRDRTRRLPRRR